MSPRRTARVSMSISSSDTSRVVCIAEHRRRRRVADEHDVDAGRLDDARRRIVVRRHHDDALGRARFSSASRSSVGASRRLRTTIVVDQPHRTNACRDRRSARRRRASSAERDVVAVTTAKYSGSMPSRAASRACRRQRRRSALALAAVDRIASPRASPRHSASARVRSSPVESRRCGSTSRGRRARAPWDTRRSRAGNREVSAPCARITATCCASFWPKNAASGATMLNSFVDDRRDAAEMLRAAHRALEHVLEPADRDRRRKAGRIHLVGGRREQHVDAGRPTPCSRPSPRRADRPRDPTASLNCVGLTNSDVTTTSHCARACRMSETCPVVERAHRRHEADRAYRRAATPPIARASRRSFE